MVTPAPEVIQSLPPVTIRHIMEGPNPWFAFLGTVAISFIALVVALITLSRVNRQIKIANKQIDLANRQITLSTEQLLLATDQLGVAREELRLVTEDLAVAMEMKALSQRTPKLTLNWQMLVAANEFIGNPPVKCHVLILRLTIPNTGSKMAKEVTAKLLFPRDCFLDSNHEQDTINGITYLVFDISDAPFTVAINNHFRRDLRLVLRASVTALPFLWRIFDDEYFYPLDDWGQGTVDLKLPPT